MNEMEYKGLQKAEEIGAKLAELSKLIEAIHYDPEGITKNDIYRLEKINNRLEITINDFYKLEKINNCLREAKEIQENQKEAQAAK